MSLDQNPPGLRRALPSPEVEVQLQSVSNGLGSPPTLTASSRFETSDSNQLQFPSPRQHLRFIHLLKTRIVGKMKQWRFRVSAKRKRSQQDGEHAFIKDMLLFKGGDSQTTTLRRARLDTGAVCNLITQRSLIDVEHKMDGTGFRILGLLEELNPQGKTRLKWIFREEGEIHEDDFLILPDYAQADFDVLLGRDWMNRNGYRLQNNVVWVHQSLAGLI